MPCERGNQHRQLEPDVRINKQHQDGPGLGRASELRCGKFVAQLVNRARLMIARRAATKELFQQIGIFIRDIPQHREIRRSFHQIGSDFINARAALDRQQA
jgi:hypothetical protein